ncbi:MAG: LysM peptidoglycan-binding domain-containing protein [Patescibacteria group bacterium]|nr:LysM peptidoglycan-binding domain-containing protein [Patescibacteria group bacterium]
MRKIITGMLVVMVMALISSLVFAQAEMEEKDLRTYIVKKGDTLNDIISMLEIKEATEIVQWNPGLTKNIAVGQKIKYKFEKFLKEGKKWSESLAYTIQKGDTPERVAKKLGVPGSKLLEWNPDMGVRFIYIGQGIFYKEIKDIPKSKPIVKSLTKVEPKPKPKSSIASGQTGQLKFKIVTDQIDSILEKQNDLVGQFSTQVDLLDYIDLSLKELRENIGWISVLLFFNFTMTIIISLLLLWLIWVNKRSSKRERRSKKTKSSWADGIFTNVATENPKRDEEIEEEIYQQLQKDTNEGKAKKEEAKKEEAKEEKVWVRVDGKDYWYKAPKKGGKYVSLHINPKTKQPYLFKRKEDLIKSLKKTFKDRPDFLKEEIKKGRLIEIDTTRRRRK